MKPQKIPSKVQDDVKVENENNKEKETLHKFGVIKDEIKRKGLFVFDHSYEMNA